jgi:hypothetical protein
MPLILGTNSIKDTGYDVANSLRFNAGSSDSLTKTFGTPTNNRIWTYSFWMKHCDNAGVLLNTGADTSYMYFRGSSANPVPFGFSIEQYVSSFQYKLIPNEVFRDHSAWQHIVIAFDTTQSTASNRVKIYKNGSQITSFNSEDYPSQNLDTQVNSAVAHKIGGHGSSGFYDGYLCEVVFIDGQQLAPDQFGEFDEDSPTIWKPKDVSGLTFGNNGFYLDFEDSSALGNDVSGNNNDFTANNLTAIDQSTDTCTNNFATWNPLMKPSSASTFSEGNLKVTNGTNSVYPYSVSNQGFSQGKWYAEFKYTPSGNAGQIGIMDLEIATTNFQANNVGSSSDGCITYQYNGNIIGDGTVHSTGHTSLSSGDIVGVAVDEDNELIYFYVNGTLQNSGGTDYSGDAFTSGFVGFYCGDASGGGTDTWEANFGSPPFTISSGNSDANGFGNFEYAVPSGYYSLNTKNLSEFG